MDPAGRRRTGTSAYAPPFPKPSGTEAVTIGVAIDVSGLGGAVVDVVVSPSVISGPSLMLPGESLKTTVSAPHSNDCAGTDASRGKLELTRFHL